MRARTWRWLRCRILGLLEADTRIMRHFAPEPPPLPDALNDR